MKLGNGEIKLAVLAEDSIPCSKLTEIVIGTLAVVPLNEQFGEVTFYRIPADSKEESFIEETEKALWGKGTLIAVITPSWLKSGKVEDGIIYSSRHPVVFAHEIGHVLGLRHPEKCDAVQVVCPSNVPRCENARYIMGCPKENDPLEFSPSDVEILRERYKAIYGRVEAQT